MGHRRRQDAAVVGAGALLVHHGPIIVVTPATKEKVIAHRRSLLLNLGIGCDLDGSELVEEVLYAACASILVQKGEQDEEHNGNRCCGSVME